MPLPIPERFRDDVESLSPLLRVLLDAELASGNRIRRVEPGDPAPSDGVCVMLAKPVSTRARATGDGLTFWLESSAEYKASFTDHAARDFILEAPLESDGAYPDMDEIREELGRASAISLAPTAGTIPRAATDTTNFSTVDRFRAGMTVDYEMWHDGVGYELDLLMKATDADKAIILGLLVPPKGWRDVEALAALDNADARVALHLTLQSGNAEVRAAVLRYAPAIAGAVERTETMLRALSHGQFFDDLTSVLDQVKEYHPPEIVNALFRGLLARPGDIATNYAGMLAFIYGKADSTFDWDLRPLFLKFNTDDGAERTQVLASFCAWLELDLTEVMARIKE